jgi:diacylglycerol O-acyltransferase / wax synthase
VARAHCDRGAKALTRPLSLSPADLSAVQAEQGPVHMHVGGVLILGGRIPAATVIRRIEERIHLIPHYRMRLVESAPGGLVNPVWEDDPDFDVAQHVATVPWPEPGGDAELCQVVGEAMSTRLDRSRALWEILVVDGAAHGRTALVVKMHHALVDGIAAIGVGTIIFDPTPEPLDLPPPTGAPEQRQRIWVDELSRLMPQLRGERRLELIEPLMRRVPADLVPDRRALQRVATAQLDVPRRFARSAVERARSLDPRQAHKRVGEGVQLIRDLARVRPAAPATRLNQEIGRNRLFALGRARLDDVKQVRVATGATVNDVLLTAVALMLSDYLGDEAPERTVALVPVSVRTDSHSGELGNRISTVFVDLPMGGEPLERLGAISAAMRDVKSSAQVRAGSLIVGAAGLAPPIVSALAARAMSAPRVFNLVVSNVPGPQQTFYLDGVPLREVYPAVPLNPRNQALSVGILSYDGGVYFGLLADRGALPDVVDAAAQLEAAVARLAAAAPSR